MFKMFVWSNHYSFLAVAQAESVAEARADLLAEIGQAGSNVKAGQEVLTELAKASAFIVENTPTIWRGRNVEFALTDSAALRAADDEVLRLSALCAKHGINPNEGK